ncbi:Ankyrin repeat domain-containing protein 16 [Apophysomyces ossiformis]|uniref:Ankyrin repeat domain-containing protein 16 n=1 Tax=Apophysomyces ossiformis TaxID=679940 RepID=A0A8H7ETK7_9FUNG|nr:Ankyrin repeat domain-containing protein 16 [Apophysomyces ossiformis]
MSNAWFQIRTAELLEKTLNECDNKEELIDAKDSHGDALVHFAARMHSLAMLKMLHKHGANMGAVNEHGRQALHEAIDSLECVSYLVNVCKVDVNALKRGDWTPIMIADGRLLAMKGRLDIVKVLVDAGALLDRATKDGRTALHLAVQQGHPEMTSYLARQCPKAIIKSTNSGRLPVQIAAALCDTPDSLLQIIMDLVSNAPVPLSAILAHRDKSGRSVLLDAVVSRNLTLLEYLLNQGADPNETDAIGRNMIHHASMMGHLDVLQLIAQIAEEQKWVVHWDIPDAWDRWTPLMHAAKEGNVKIVQFLLDKPIDKTKVDKQGRTAKDLACMWQREAVIAYL